MQKKIKKIKISDIGEAIHWEINNKILWTTDKNIVEKLAKRGIKPHTIVNKVKYGFDKDKALEVLTKTKLEVT